MTFANFRISEKKKTVSKDVFTHLVNKSKVKSHYFSILVGISPQTALLVLRS